MLGTRQNDAHGFQVLSHGFIREAKAGLFSQVVSQPGQRPEGKLQA
jgi:hypothetical protein